MVPDAGRPTLLLVGGALIVCAAVAAAIVVTTRGGAHLSLIAPNSLAVIDANTNRLVGQIAVGDRPSRLAVSNGTLWVLNGGDGTISEIDTKTDHSALPFGPSLSASDLTATQNAVWVGNAANGAGAGASTVARFDPARHVRLERPSSAATPLPAAAARPRSGI